MKIVRTGTKKFEKALDLILKRGETDSTAVRSGVEDTLKSVRADGDKALLELTARFDGVRLKKSEIRVKKSELKAALNSIPKRERELLELAHSRIESFHRKQVQFSWYDSDDDGTVLGQKVTPLEKVGLYVPGGKASYPSTVLMSAVPAKVAGVAKVCMTTPPGKKGIDPYVLAAASIAGVDEVFRVGGAQAIAALAYGTETVTKVDKIVGPGNIYVATAKSLVFGTVDIDMIAGPSEILIINDGTGDPSWIAADLLGQAEHDELASAVLITTSTKMAKAVSAEVVKQLKRLKRRQIATSSIESYGLIIVARSIKEAADISNRVAPEHLELFVAEPFKAVDLITNAGAIFLGEYSPEAAGDYLAGPNHTLPTGGTARFSSPLGVEDFIKRSSVIFFTKEGYTKLGRDIKRFADLEGLEAHGLSAQIRFKKKSRRG